MCRIRQLHQSICSFHVKCCDIWKDILKKNTKYFLINAYLTGKLTVLIFSNAGSLKSDIQHAFLYISKLEGEICLADKTKSAVLEPATNSLVAVCNWATTHITSGQRRELHSYHLRVSTRTTNSLGRRPDADSMVTRYNYSMAVLVNDIFQYVEGKKV